MAERLIKIRYGGTCSVCDQALAARTQAWWDGATKTLRCENCGDPPRSRVDAGIAGQSAQRKHDRLHDRRETAVRERFPRIGGLLLALSEDPQSTRAWAAGALGERKVGEGLDSLAESGVVALHDRRIPGSKANIDHIAIAPSGVWVIDTKRYGGEVTKRDKGGWLSSDLRLYVGGRDRTKLVHAMANQVAAVRTALGEDWADVPVKPVLCFVDSQWPLFSRAFVLEGVTIAWPKAVAKLLTAEGPYQPEGIDLIAARLSAQLPPA